MINASKRKQVEDIKKYLESNSDKYCKLVIFGKSITEESKESDFLELAVEMTNQKDANDDNALLDLFCKVDDITNGKFDLVIINCQNNSSNVMDLISKGEVVYG